MQPIFVTATGTGVGKTYATLRLLELADSLGVRVGAFKAVETGVVDQPADARALWQKLRTLPLGQAPGRAEDLCGATFPLPAAPFCADKRGSLDPGTLLDQIREAKTRCDLLIVEGAGGLMVPITREYFMIDLIAELGATALLVTPSRLGCINETLLSLEALKRRKIPHDWCVNLHEDAESFPEVTRPFYDAAFPGWWTLQEGLERFVRDHLTQFATMPIKTGDRDAASG